MRRVYCDANATTPLLAGGDGGDAPVLDGAVRERVVDSSRGAAGAQGGGPGARDAGAVFHCREAEVVFNSGGTEGDNTAIFGLVRAGDHLITTSIEHSAVLRAAERVAERGAEVTFVAPRANGLIDPEEIRGARSGRRRRG